MSFLLCLPALDFPHLLNTSTSLSLERTRFGGITRIQGARKLHPLAKVHQQDFVNYLLNNLEKSVYSSSCYDSKAGFLLPAIQSISSPCVKPSFAVFLCDYVASLSFFFLTWKVWFSGLLQYIPQVSLLFPPHSPC